MPVLTKRWNDPAEPSDGYRLLICRFRPRGVARQGEPWDAWCKALGPSEELHADFYRKGVGPELSFEDYDRRFREEMTRQQYWLRGFAAQVRRGETITLLCSSACVDPARCHRTIVASLLSELAFPRTPEPGTDIGTRIVRRRSL